VPVPGGGGAISLIYFDDVNMAGCDLQ
jgi:hypothetical protein